MKMMMVTAVVMVFTGSAAAQTPPPQPPAQQAPPAAAKPAADVTGRWDVMVSTDQGEIPASLVLKKDGTKIVGSIAGPQGEAPVEASVEEKNVSIWFSMDTSNGPIAITMNGTLEGNAMKGMVDIGGSGSASWTATRAAAAPAATTPDAKQDSTPAVLDVSGTWMLEVNTPAGTGTPTLVLKQQGEKLTGSYTSNQFGEAAVTGSLKGNAISFAFDLNIEGNAVTVVYTGTVEKDTMSGSLKFGEYADGTFTGKKK